MTDPRLHRLAQQALERMARGADPVDAIVMVLSLAAGRSPLAAVYDGLPWRSRAICLAMYGEEPLRAKDVHALIGGSYHSIHELLRRLMVHGLIRRVGYGRYTLVDQDTAPSGIPKLSRKPAEAA